MKAMLVKDGKLLFTDVEMPSVKDDEIRIKIKAIGINRADLLQKKGTYPSPKGWPEWPGLEVSGTVDAMGEVAKQKGRFTNPLFTNLFCFTAAATVSYIQPIKEYKKNSNNILPNEKESDVS